MELVKVNFRDQIRQVILEEVINNQVRPGQKLSLVEYANRVKASVTPIREAFTQLEQMGILEAIPNVGFCVKAISRDEAAEIYSLIGLIEANVVSKANCNPKLIQRLRKLSDRVIKSKSVEKRLVNDNRFHEILINREEHPVSHTMLQNLKTRVVLFELQFMIDREANMKLLTDHEAIISLLETGRPKQAARLVQEHWNNSYQFIIKIGTER